MPYTTEEFELMAMMNEFKALESNAAKKELAVFCVAYVVMNQMRVYDDLDKFLEVFSTEIKHAIEEGWREKHGGEVLSGAVH